MSTDPRKASATDKTPAEIRAEIDETREQLGDTVEALAAKTDVKGRAKAKIEDAKQQAKAKVEEAREAAPESPEEASQQAQAFGRGAQKAAEENPRPFLIAGTAAAFILLWRLLRS